jgi:phenylacetate-CoA ligase
MPAKPLQALVDYVRRNSPFYAELYRDVPEAVSHLSQLPIVDQGAYWEANRFPDNRLLTGPLTDAGVYMTGGTTGAPKLSPWTRSEHADAVTMFGAGVARSGLRPGHRVANLFWAGELYAGFLFIEHALHHAPVENVRLPIAGSASDEYVADLIAALDINVLAGLPVKLASVAEVVTARGQAADSVELLLFGGDLLFDDVRPGLARAFPKAAISSLGYASIDAGLIGGPVPGDDVRVHEAFTPYVQAEIVDDVTDEPITTPGLPGRLVVTNMFRTLMPIIRYPAGDRAVWIDPERQRFRLVGRTDEGARVGPVAMRTEDVHDALIAADPDRVVGGVQMVMRRWGGTDDLLLRLVCDAEPPAEFTRRLIDAVYAAHPTYPKQVELGNIRPIAVEWVRAGDLVTNPRSGKLVRVVDERPHSEASGR